MHQANDDRRRGDVEQESEHVQYEKNRSRRISRSSFIPNLGREKLLTSCDIIVLSGLALTIFGLFQVSDRLSVKASAAAVLIPWAIYLAAAMVMPALS